MLFLELFKLRIKNFFFFFVIYNDTMNFQPNLWSGDNHKVVSIEINMEV